MLFRSSPQIVGEYFKATAGLDILSVPYRGGEQARLDLLGGQIDMNVVPLSNVLSMVQEKTVKALAVTHRKRDPLLPDVPTMAESGYPQLGFDPDVWLAIFSAPGTPEAVVNVLHAKINESLASREMRAAYERLGIGMRSGTIEELTTLLTAHMGKWPEILRLANVQPPT